MQSQKVGAPSLAGLCSVHPHQVQAPEAACPDRLGRWGQRAHGNKFELQRAQAAEARQERRELPLLAAATQ